MPGKPKGKQRPRFSGHAYTPRETIDYEDLVGSMFHKSGGKMFSDEKPLNVSIVARFSVPVSWSEYRKRRAEHGLITPGKPDADNIAKIVMDGLNGIAYADDKQIAFLQVRKEYCSEKHPTEGVLVSISSQSEESHDR